MPSIMRPDLIEVIVHVFGGPERRSKTFRGKHAVSSALEYGRTKGETLSDVFVLSSSGDGLRGTIQVRVIPGNANPYHEASILPERWGSHVHVTREISIAGPGFVPVDWQVPTASEASRKSSPRELVPVPGGGLRPN